LGVDVLERELPNFELHVHSWSTSEHVEKFGKLAFVDLHVNTLAMTVTVESQPL